ncbi:MAG: hypothetical protein K0R44_3323, partial [Thermomicrobiales bacterium]|nr:hypothetical protein [Thermomicrobiales bacterium]
MDPSQQQPGRERRHRGAEAERAGPDRVDEAPRTRNDSTLYLTISGEVFGGAVQNDVRAERNRSKERRREKGIVDHQEQIVFVGKFGQHSNIADPKERVREWLDIDGPRPRRNGSLDSIDIRKIDEARRAAQCGKIISHEVAGQVIEL